MSSAVEDRLRPQCISDQLIVELGQVLQRERSAEAASSDGGEDFVEIEDALWVSQGQVLLPCLRPTIR
jgi:hypothetical protein